MTQVSVWRRQRLVAFVVRSRKHDSPDGLVAWTMHLPACLPDAPSILMSTATSVADEYAPFRQHLITRLCWTAPRGQQVAATA